MNIKPDEHNQKLIDKAIKTKKLCQKALDIVLPDLEDQIVFLNTTVDTQVNKFRTDMGWKKLELNSIDDIHPANFYKIGKIKNYVMTLYMSKGFSWYQLENNDLIIKVNESKLYKILKQKAIKLVDENGLNAGFFEIHTAPDEYFLLGIINQIKKEIKSITRDTRTISEIMGYGVGIKRTGD